MKIVGILLLIGCLLASIFVGIMAISVTATASVYGPDLFGYYIAGAIIGALLFYGVILYGFGALDDRLRLVNHLLLDIRNQAAGADRQLTPEEAVLALNRAHARWNIPTVAASDEPAS